VTRLTEADTPFLLNIFYSTTHPPFASEWPWYSRFSAPAYTGESKFAMARLTDPFDIIRRQGAPREDFDLDQILDLYDGCVAQFDDEVGKLIRHLATCGLAENTIVVVYSDHGMEFFEHETWGQGNSAVGDFSARIPLVIHDPRISSVPRIDDVVRSVDIVPTLLDLAGTSIPKSVEGISLAPAIRGDEKCPQLDAFNETGVWVTHVPGLPEDHLRYPDLFELLEVPDRETGTLAIKSKYYDTVLRAKDRMIRRGPWKLVLQPLSVGAGVLLFNVEQDPNCSRNVAADYPEINEALSSRLRMWMTDDLVSPDKIAR